MIGVSVARVRARTHRLVASRFPTVGIFDDLTRDPAALRSAFLLENATNARLRTLATRVGWLEDDDLVRGETASLVMAAFLHADPEGGRFTDGRLGAWYASRSLETAIHETVHHCARRLRASEGGFPNAIQVRELLASVDAEFVDVRGLGARRGDLYHPSDYRASRAFGVAVRWPDEGTGANGIIYDSVRHAGGTNLCVYRPRLVRLPIVQGAHLEYRWDASGTVTVLRLSRIDLAPSGG